MSDLETMTLIEKTVFLSTVEMFKHVPTEALAQLAARATEVRCDRGHTLFREGEEDRGTFIVVDGVIELRKGDSVVRILGPARAHGELFLRDNEPHQYSGIARDDAHLLQLSRADVVDALVEYPELGLAMVQELAMRLHRLTQRLIELESELKARGGEAPGAAIEPTEPAPDVPRQRGWWRRPQRTVPKGG